MHFYKTLLACALVVVSTVAQGTLMFTSFPPATVEVGKPVTVTWSGGTGGPVTIVLRRGPKDHLEDVSTLTTTATGGTFTFTLPSDSVDGSDYALEIKQGTEINFTDEFAVAGGSGVSSSASASSTASSSASVTSSAKSSQTSSSESSSSSSSSSSESSSTKSSASSTSTSSITTTTSRSSTSTPAATTTSAPSGGAASLSSPFALILGALAAFVYLN